MMYMLAKFHKQMRIDCSSDIRGVSAAILKGVVYRSTSVHLLRRSHGEGDSGARWIVTQGLGALFTLVQSQRNSERGIGCGRRHFSLSERVNVKMVIKNGV